MEIPELIHEIQIHEILLLMCEDSFQIYRKPWIDQVWHDIIIFKLKAYDVEVELVSLLKNYLQSREQRIVLNGQMPQY